MTSITDSGPQELLSAPNYAVVSTVNKDGSIHSTIVWVSAEGDDIAVNSAVGRLWPTNLERDPHVSVVVFESGNPYHFVEVRGTATGSTTTPTSTSTRSRRSTSTRTSTRSGSPASSGSSS